MMKIIKQYIQENYHKEEKLDTLLLTQQLVKYDAQGFGYKSRKKAYAGYYYKRNYAKEKNQNKAVEYWLHSHPEFCDELTYHVFAHFKEGRKEKLDENLVQMVLKELGLDAPCKINKLIKVWKNFR